MPSDQKLCKTCRGVKPVDDFNRNSKSKDRLQYNCRVCSSRHLREWKLKNPERNAERTRQWRRNNPIRQKVAQWLWNGINMTASGYLALLQSQNNNCALCGIPRTKLAVDFAVDHDHKTGKVRGLLCQKCNRGLGHFQDSPDLLRKAVAYLGECP
jgi:hypothetical protein